jgi:hypothetical protein
MEKIRLKELYSIYENLSALGDNSELDSLRELILRREEEIVEDTSGTGGPVVSGTSGSAPSGGGVAMADASTAGMGGVHSSQPSAFPGTLNGTAWISGGGKEGSGDVSIPYNPTGANRMFQKMKSPMGKNHGSSTGKKSRIKGLDLKKLRSMKSTKQDPSTKPKRIMKFDDFAKKDLLTKVTKVKE